MSPTCWPGRLGPSPPKTNAPNASAAKRTSMPSPPTCGASSCVNQTATGTSRSLRCRHYARIRPHEPVRVQVLSSVLAIERPRRRVLWIHIDANASRLTAREPCRERSQELTGDSGAATCRDHIQPFQLSVATEASREMSRDEADNVLPAFGDEHHPRRQGLLRM